VVVWVFAGGGETEASGLIKFLESTFPHHAFERKLPFNSKKPRSKPNKKIIVNEQKKDKESTFGITGERLAKAIKIHLDTALDKAKSENNRRPKFPDLILVIDDLDCRNLEIKNQKLEESIEKVLEKKNINNVEKYIVFAAPEIEVWIMADWEHTIAKSAKFKNRQVKMRRWFNTEKHFPFERPESFGEYDPNKKSCKEKLSELLIVSSRVPEDQGKEYKKSEDSPDLLLLIEKTVLCQKCPMFRDFYYFMQRLNTN
jgi:hypothetical protein